MNRHTSQWVTTVPRKITLTLEENKWETYCFAFQGLLALAATHSHSVMFSRAPPGDSPSAPSVCTPGPPFSWVQDMIQGGQTATLYHMLKCPRSSHPVNMCSLLHSRRWTCGWHCFLPHCLLPELLGCWESLISKAPRTASHPSSG